MPPKALILLASGTNRDGDVAQALTLAGADPYIVPLQGLRQLRSSWQEFQILVIAGGFSYADALGAGKLLALDLMHFFADQAAEFVAAGKPVLGICNGFQALVKAGILPSGNASPHDPEVTLTFNDCGHFECRWITLKPVSQVCLWTRGLDDLIECPVAHGEGNFIAREPAVLHAFAESDQIALVYAKPDGTPANGEYPHNPNGSMMDIAGICNPAGNVLGLMPHPEDHVLPQQYVHWNRQARHSGLPLFQNAVRYVQDQE
ncbi:MAG: phosphoribosylformylglycinamidine synthase I [Anaerolineales bacterium]|nr:phosphoribosylformylglycinamidine synthase I [Anaerolineales bacterium]